MTDPKIIFLAGAADKSKLLNALIDASANVVALVVPESKKYENAYTKMVSSAIEKKIPVIYTPPKEIYEFTKNINFDILISSGYPFVIPEEVFSRAKYAINFHPTLLPKYRGRYLHYILINNDPETGVTAHFIDSSLDTGPIIGQIKYPVSSFDTIKSLSRKNIDAEVKLVLEVLHKITQGTIAAQAQDESQASSYFEKRVPEDSEIDPSKPLQDLFYEIRCCDPELYPAYFHVDGQKVYIKLFRKEKPEDELDMI